MPNLARFIPSLPTLDLTGALDIALVAFVLAVLVFSNVSLALLLMMALPAVLELKNTRRLRLVM